jgi:hypothetical protein
LVAVATSGCFWLHQPAWQLFGTKMILNKSLKSDDDSRTRDSPQKDWQQNKTLLKYATQY